MDDLKGDRAFLQFWNVGTVSGSGAAVNSYSDISLIDLAAGPDGSGAKALACQPGRRRPMTRQRASPCSCDHHPPPAADPLLGERRVEGHRGRLRFAPAAFRFASSATAHPEAGEDARHHTGGRLLPHRGRLRFAARQLNSPRLTSAMKSITPST